MEKERERERDKDRERERKERKLKYVRVNRCDKSERIGKGMEQ